MQGANVCVAGIDLKSSTQVRLAEPTPTRAQLRRLGDLHPGDSIEVDLHPLRAPTAPHVEDCRWDPASVKKIRRLPFFEIGYTATRYALPSVEAAFGAPWFTSAGGNSAWRPQTGERSRATLEVRYVRLALNKSGQIRIAFKDMADGYYHSVPFQDLRVKTHECPSCNDAPLVHSKREFESNGGLVRVGLTRAFAQPGHETACWLQVTNVFARERTHFV